MERKFTITISPDKEKVDKINIALQRNGGYCPCVSERSEDTKCICKKMRETGQCCCGLYVAKMK